MSALSKRYAISWNGGPPLGGFHTEDTLRDLLEFTRNNRAHMIADARRRGVDMSAHILGSIGRGAYSDRAVTEHARARFNRALKGEEP